MALLQRRPSHRHSTAVIALVAIVMSLLPILSAWSAAAAQDGGPDVLRIHRRFYPVLLDPQRGGFLPDVSVTEIVTENQDDVGRGSGCGCGGAGKAKEQD